jgi:hypothetical protein
MSTSTEATLRTVIANAIKAIAQEDLGFDVTNGNVREYLLDYHPPENESKYLSAKVNNKPVYRAWAVEVTPIEENLTATGMIYYRLYQVIVRGYYALSGGDDVNTLIDHARAVRGAIKGLQLHFSHTVDLIESIDPLNMTIEDSVNGRLLVGDIVYRLRRENPDF